MCHFWRFLANQTIIIVVLIFIAFFLTILNANKHDYYLFQWQKFQLHNLKKYFLFLFQWFLNFSPASF